MALDNNFAPGQSVEDARKGIRLLIASHQRKRCAANWSRDAKVCLVIQNSRYPGLAIRFAWRRSGSLVGYWPSFQGTKETRRPFIGANISSTSLRRNFFLWPLVRRRRVVRSCLYPSSLAAKNAFMSSTKGASGGGRKIEMFADHHLSVNRVDMPTVITALIRLVVIESHTSPRDDGICDGLL